MANIRTQLVSNQRRIITKVIEGQRRVSCSCCKEEAECCMYPANQLGIGYTEDDLPDTIDVSGIILGVPTRIIASRNGSFYGPINQSIFNGTPFSTYVFVATNPFDEIVWVEDTTNGVYTSPLGEDACLIRGNFPEPSVIDDTFADTYKIAGQSGSAIIPESTLIRTGLCRWDGVIQYVEADFTTTIEVILTYCGNESDICGFIEDPIAGNTFAPRQYKWIMTFSTAPQSFKNAPQKSPEGRYPLSTDPNDYLDVYV